MSSTTSETSLLSIERNEFELFRTLVHRHTGIWLRDGKQVMLASRLTGRMRLHGMTDFADYYAYVTRHCGDGKELGALINCVTTNKTSFFRENHHFEFLSDVVVPEIVGSTRLPAAANDGSTAARLPANKSISIWSAACSTGEEPYSIAMALLESQSKLGVFRGAGDIRIVASDIDTKVLNKALRGIYSEHELESVEPVLQKKYFLRGKDEMSGQIKVKKQVASLVEFQRINLMDRSWQLDTAFDAIFFRNALIYFQQDTQDLFLRRMVRYLRPGGYLFLGHSEHIPWLHHILEPLQKTIYRLRVTEA
ncbi:MAG: protein-glutamate O-methyltransferase CheR [Acidobacteriaceae bacterium]